MMKAGYEYRIMIDVVLCTTCSPKEKRKKMTKEKEERNRCPLSNILQDWLVLYCMCLSPEYWTLITLFPLNTDVYNKWISRELSIPPASISLLGTTLSFLQKKKGNLFMRGPGKSALCCQIVEWQSYSEGRKVYTGAEDNVSAVRNKRTEKTSIIMDKLNFQAQLTFLSASHKLSKQ